MDENLFKDTPRSVGETLRQLQRIFEPRFGKGEAKSMARLIFQSLKGWDLTALTINSDKELSDYILDKIEAITARVLKNEPIQYILGEARFYGMNLKVTPDVLIPRQETEELVDLIVAENKEPDLKVLDIGTGSGAIAIALARNLKFPEITAIDISEEALKVAIINAETLHAKIDFRNEDVFSFEARNQYDIIVSNPPYVTESEKSEMESNVLEYEPHLALFVDDRNPLLYYNRIAEVARTALTPGGRLYFEINSRFGAELVEMLDSFDFRNIALIRDISHRNRFIRAVKP